MKRAARVVGWTLVVAGCVATPFSCIGCLSVGLASKNAVVLPPRPLGLGAEQAFPVDDRGGQHLVALRVQVRPDGRAPTNAAPAAPPAAPTDAGPTSPRAAPTDAADALVARVAIVDEAGRELARFAPRVWPPSTDQGVAFAALPGADGGVGSDARLSWHATYDAPPNGRYAVRARLDRAGEGAPVVVEAELAVEAQARIGGALGLAAAVPLALLGVGGGLVFLGGRRRPRRDA